MKRVLVLALILTALIFVSGCGGNDGDASETSGQQDSASDGFPVVVTDGMGREIEIPEEPQRIVSLAPAATEILFALDLGEKVVGVTDYCDYPSEAQDKKKIGGFENPNIEQIISLEPDLIVCTGGVQKDYIDRLEELGQNVYTVNPENIDGIFDTIGSLGRASGNVEQASRLISDMEERLNKVKEKVDGLNKQEKTKTFIIIWIDESKIITAGPDTFVSNVVEIAGGINIASDVEGDYPQFSKEKLFEENPEAVISTAHKYDKPEEVKQVLEWEDLNAVKNDRVYTISDGDLITLPGPRIVEGIERVAEYLHPELFSSE